MSHFNFKDKIAVVTGSGRGLGKATALLFAKQGADIVINDLDESNAKQAASEVEKLGRKVLISNHDISKTDQAQKLFEEIHKTYSRVDILVNNAGITRDAMLHKMSEKLFDQVIAVNVKGVFNCAQNAAKMMVAQKSGRIINLASVSALGNIGQTNYSASKAAVMGMTRTMALELSRFGITVNAIAPGFFKSVLTDQIPDEVKEKFKRRIPLGRFGEPEEIGKLASFLASDDAAYVTGQTFFMDGGLSVGITGV